MIKRKIFYSFHFDNDVMRVQLVRNMGVVEGNAAVTPNGWEEVRRKGRANIENWIDNSMADKSCVVVLIGTETSTRPLVQYEIQRAWELGKGLVGIYIHSLTCPRNGKSLMGANPFDQFTFRRGGQILRPPVHNPVASDSYADISRNLPTWIESAIQLQR